MPPICQFKVFGRDARRIVAFANDPKIEYVVFRTATSLSKMVLLVHGMPGGYVRYQGNMLPAIDLVDRLHGEAVPGGVFPVTPNPLYVLSCHNEGMREMVAPRSGFTVRPYRSIPGSCFIMPEREEYGDNDLVIMECWGGEIPMRSEEMEVWLFCETNELYNHLNGLGLTTLREIFKVDKVTLIERRVGRESPTMPGLYIKIVPCDLPFCERCRRRDAGVGTRDGYPNLCPRCVDVLLQPAARP